MARLTGRVASGIQEGTNALTAAGRDAINGNSRLGMDPEGNKKGSSGNKKGNTVSDIVDTQAEANELLRNISEKLSDLKEGRGDSSPLSGDGESSNPLETAGTAEAVKGMEGKVSEMAGNTATTAEASGGMLGNMRGMMGSMNGLEGGLKIVNAVLGGIRSVLSAINDTVAGGIEDSISLQKEYLGPISARLQGLTDTSTEYYYALSKNIRNVFTNSRFIDQQKLLANIAQLVEEGIGYNLEDRAFLATIADRTVKTFDVLDANLGRASRLQQMDLTRTQMGSEAYLTKFLNTYFEDTSYLNTLYDSTVGQLMEAASQLTADEATSFLFNVQKWMASLYAVGISDSAISQIVQGINYLGSGNVSQLTNDDQLNTLFAMVAQKAGLSYANLLTYGLSGTDIDKLMNSMVDYLQSIANNTSNEVLKSEYGRIFGGLSVSDIRAIQNLTNEDIKHLMDVTSQMDIDKAIGEVTTQLGKVEDRTTWATQVENMINNMIYSIGAEIAEDVDAYKSWYYADLTETLGDTMAGVIPGELGKLLGNTIGLIEEGQKAELVRDAAQNLTISYGWEDHFQFKNIRDDIAEWTEKLKKGDKDAGYKSGWEIMASNSTQADVDETLSTLDAIKDNWDLWSYFGFDGSATPFGEGVYQATTSKGRFGNYTSSISLKDNTFNTKAAEIKQEEITGFDETISESVDAMYEHFFGNDQTPIKVIISDIEGVDYKMESATRIADTPDNMGRTIIDTLNWITGQ